jgi:hypothetical protein
MDNPTATRQPERETVRSLASVPFLQEFAAEIRPLDAGQDLERAFNEVAKRALGMKRARILFSIIRDGSPIHWTLDVGSKVSKASRGRPQKQNLEVLLEEGAWWDIAEGRMTPLEAFGRGKARVRGNLEVARALMGRLAK